MRCAELPLVLLESVDILTRKFFSSKELSSACQYKQPLRTEKGLLLKTHATNVCWNAFCSVICSLSLRELITVPSRRIISSYFREALLTCPKMLQGEFSSSIHFENKWTSVGIRGAIGGIVASIKEEKDFFASECLGVLGWRFFTPWFKESRVLLRGVWLPCSWSGRDARVLFCLPVFSQRLNC